MISAVRFEKWQALGNDYVIFEAADLPFELTTERVRAICAPHLGVGSDGILLLTEPADAAAHVAELRIFNPDGSEAELSGNGVREAVLYLRPLAGRDTDEFFSDSRYGEFWVGARPTIEDVELELGLTARHVDGLVDAVAKDAGEVTVRVVRDADRKSFAAIEQNIRDLAQKAQDGSLALDDLRGGTFTITNGGIFGSMLSTPILNPPQVGILGMHNIDERPVARDGQVVIRPMMYLALSYDHRIVDGREAVQFLVKVKQLLEDPELMLLEG